MNKNNKIQKNDRQFFIGLILQIITQVYHVIFRELSTTDSDYDDIQWEPSMTQWDTKLFKSFRSNISLNLKLPAGGVIDQ